MELPVNPDFEPTLDKFCVDRQNRRDIYRVCIKNKITESRKDVILDRATEKQNINERTRNMNIIILT